MIIIFGTDFNLISLKFCQDSPCILFADGKSIAEYFASGFIKNKNRGARRLDHTEHSLLVHKKRKFDAIGPDEAPQFFSGDKHVPGFTAPARVTAHQENPPGMFLQNHLRQRTAETEKRVQTGHAHEIVKIDDEKQEFFGRKNAGFFISRKRRSQITDRIFCGRP